MAVHFVRRDGFAINLDRHPRSVQRRRHTNHLRTAFPKAKPMLLPGGFKMNDVLRSCSAPPALCAVATAASKRNGHSRRIALTRIGFSLLLLSVAVLCGQPAFAAKPTPNEMDELAAAKGCYLCHRAKPATRHPDDVLPYAPSWQDIAQRYRRQNDAQNRLTQIVLEGSGNNGKDRHWKGKVSEVGMLPNMQEIDESQAKSLAQWILSFTP